MRFEDIGELVRSDERYDLYDASFEDGFTISMTILKPGRETRGHSHENQEAYLFLKGRGKLLLRSEDGEEVVHEVDANSKPGQMFLIESNWFHKVINESDEDMIFVCLFPGERRH